MHTSALGIPLISNEESLPIDVDGSLYDREKSCLFRVASYRDTTLSSMLKFSIAAARHSSAGRQGMLDVGTLALVLTALVNSDFHLSGLHDVLGDGAPHTCGRKPDALCLYTCWRGPLLVHGNYESSPVYFCVYMKDTVCSSLCRSELLNSSSF